MSVTAHRGRKVALLVGVADVDGLPYLPGVAPGLRTVQQWADDQGFEVRVHHDADAPVSLADVFDTVRTVVQAGDARCLFVFFAGHGLAKGTGDDVWLLSKAGVRAGEAIDVAASVAAARHSGVPHVGFFADACRSPRSAEWFSVQGEPVFPRDRVAGVPVEVDQFYATVSGDPAYELVPGDGREAFGIFTSCLMSALRGEEPAALTDIGGGQYVVEARHLRTVLHQRVPEVSEIEVDAVQVPDCIPGSYWTPHALSWVVGETRGPIRRRCGSDDIPGVPVVYRAPGGVQMPDRVAGTVGRFEAGRDRIIADLSRRYLRAVTGSGLRVTGARIVSARVGGRTIELSPDSTYSRLVTPIDGARPAIVQIERADGRFWAATMMRPSAGVGMVTGPHGIEHVALGPESGRRRRDGPRGDANGLGSDPDSLATADVAAELRLGRTGVLGSREVLSLIEQGNITLALLAAYSFHRAGRSGRVARILDWSVDSAGGTVPYDLALLADRVEGLTDRILPAFPLMTRGWSLGTRFAELRQHLLPVPWTTFSGDLPEPVLHPLTRSVYRGDR